LEPLAFLDFARELLHEAARASEEPKRGTVVNRAYLGALLESARRLEPLRAGPYPTNARFYGEVAADLGSHVGAGGKDKLGTLRNYRRKADYEIKTAIPDWMPSRTVSLAEEIARVLREKLEGDARRP